MREAIEERGRHFGIAEHARPFAEGEVCRHDDGRALVQAADQMEQKLAASLGEGQITEFVENDEVRAGKIIGEPALASSSGLGFEAIDEIDCREKAAARTGADAGTGDGDRQMGFAGSRAADEHDVALLNDEAAAGEVADKSFVDRRIFEGEVVDILGERQFGDGELILDRARLLLGDLGLEQRS